MAAPEIQKKSFWRMRPLEAALSVAILAILSAILWPRFTDCGPPAPRTGLLTSIKQIATGAAIYMVDYDERLPFAEPFEFGDDPLSPYLKNESLHENPFMEKEGNRRRPNETQHEFRFAFSPIALEDKVWKRKIVDLIKAPNIEEIPIIWSGFKSDQPGICIAYGDTHARCQVDSALDKAYSPGLFGLTNPLFGRLNYIPKGAEWPPPTWSIPAADVAAYAKQVNPKRSKSP